MQQPAAPRRTVSLEEVAADSSAGTLAEARALLLEYGQFILATNQVAGFCFGSLEQEVARIPLNYTERGGGCLIARANGVAVGFVCWRDISSDAISSDAIPSDAIPSAWEMKRLWARPEARGLGLGRTLTQA